MEWKNPEAFLLLIPLFLGLAWAYWKREEKSSTLQVSSLKILRTIRPRLKARLVFLPQILKVVGLIFVIVALARPQWPNTKIKKNIEGIDIVLALDVSDSMLIEDMKPLNRLESAKETIKKFVEKRTSDRIGLVVFAGESFTMVPPTLDYQLLLDRVKDITTARSAHIKDGTALGVALANAAGRLKDSQAKSRVIIFMTDGENNSGMIDPETGLEIALGYGLKIYSIGIGRDGPTRIPVFQKDFFGNKVKTYQPFESTVNEDLLGTMAKRSGGKYFRASREDSLTGVFEEIDRLEKTKVDVNKYTRWSELFQNYLKWGLFFYLLGAVLGATWLRRNP